MHIICTGLSSVESREVAMFANTYKATMESSWSPRVTHVVVRTDEDGGTDRTLKYLQGVAGGCWVVSCDWIKESRRMGKIMPEVRFDALSRRTVGSRGGDLIAD